MLVTGDDDPGYNYVNQDKGWRIQEKLYLGSKDVLKLSPAMHSCPALDLFDSNPVFVRCDIHTEGGKGNKKKPKTVSLRAYSLNQDSNLPHLLPCHQGSQHPRS